jgi:hypothetical protein
LKINSELELEFGKFFFFWSFLFHLTKTQITIAHPNPHHHTQHRHLALAPPPSTTATGQLPTTNHNPQSHNHNRSWGSWQIAASNQQPQEKESTGHAVAMDCAAGRSLRRAPQKASSPFQRCFRSHHRRRHCHRRRQELGACDSPIVSHNQWSEFE